jgi:DNA-binding NtrC family response regulator
MALLSSGKKIYAENIPEEIFSKEHSSHLHPPKTYEELKEVKKVVKNETIAELERQFLQHALQENGWNISKTATAVGIDRRQLQNMIKKYDLK